jgi:hypothetical protein
MAQRLAEELLIQRIATDHAIERYDVATGSVMATSTKLPASSTHVGAAVDRLVGGRGGIRGQASTISA